MSEKKTDNIADKIQWLLLSGSSAERFKQWQQQTKGFNVEQKLFAEVARRQLPLKTQTQIEGWCKAQLRIAKKIKSNATMPEQHLAYAAWDAASIAAARFRREKASPLPLGCHSLAMPNAAEAGVLHGRVFDGFLPDSNDASDDHMRKVQLALHREKQKLSFISVHHLGAFSTLSAVNERGLSLSAHAVATRAVSENGMAAFSIFEHILQNCSGLRSAEEFLRRQRPASGWLVVLSYAKSQSILLVELDANGASLVHRRRAAAAAAQGFRSKKQSQSFAPSDLFREQEWSKLSLLNRIARQKDLDAQGLLCALQDDKDAYDATSSRAFGNALLNFTHSDSVVFDVTGDALWLRIGPLPRLQQILALKLSDLFNGRATSIVQKETLCSVERTNAEVLFQAMTSFKKDVQKDLQKGAETAKHAIAAHFKQALPPYILGEVLAHLHFFDNEPEQALYYAQHALSSCSSPYREGALHLLQGRSLDLLGRRPAAKRAYADVFIAISGTHPSLEKRAWRGTRKIFSRRDISMLRFWPEVVDVVN